jgi:hypothetical protein
VVSMGTIGDLGCGLVLFEVSRGVEGFLLLLVLHSTIKIWLNG